MKKDQNNESFKKWMKSSLFDGILEAVFGSLILYTLLWVIYKTGDLFYIYAGSLLTILFLLFILLRIYCFSKMNNNFDPIEENKLKEELVALCKEHGFPFDSIEIVDTSK